METERKDILNTIVAEADKINSTLNNLHAKFISHNSSVADEVGYAMKALELAMEIIVRNTNFKTNKIDPYIFERVKCDQLTSDLKRVGLLSRQLEREINHHDTSSAIR